MMREILRKAVVIGLVLLMLMMSILTLAVKR